MRRLAPGHKFLVCLGDLTLSFSKILGIGNDVEVTTINEGGLNDRLIMLYSPKKTAGKLIFEHGVGYINPINKSFEAAMLGYYFRMPGMIVSFISSDIQRVYGYSGAAPVKWSLSSFDAQNSNILIDTVEIMHNGIYEIPYTPNN